MDYNHAKMNAHMHNAVRCLRRRDQIYVMYKNYASIKMHKRMFPIITHTPYTYIMGGPLHDWDWWRHHRPTLPMIYIYIKLFISVLCSMEVTEATVGVEVKEA